MPSSDLKLNNKWCSFSTLIKVSSRLSRHVNIVCTYHKWIRYYSHTHYIHGLLKHLGLRNAKEEALATKRSDSHQLIRSGTENESVIHSSSHKIFNAMIDSLGHFSYIYTYIQWRNKKVAKLQNQSSFKVDCRMP